MTESRYPTRSTQKYINVEVFFVLANHLALCCRETTKQTRPLTTSKPKNMTVHCAIRCRHAYVVPCTFRRSNLDMNLA